MSTLDDKILGEKLHYYCSSDEEVDNEEEEEDRTHHKSNDSQEYDLKNTSIIRNEQIREWEGYSVNTGPKGVIKDWQRYKQFEVERKESQEMEKLQLMKKLSLECRSQELAHKSDAQNSDEEMDSLLSNPNDPFLKEYMLRRMEEMMEQIETDSKERPIFGKLVCLNSGADFLQAIDKEKKFVTIVCHIYSNDMNECEAMNGCLQCLAEQYPNVKFCSLEASSAGMSKNFEKSGVPALLVYKGGNLLGNFVRLTDEFGDNFFAVDVEKFLVEHGVLNQSLVPKLITSRRSIRESAVDDEDSE